MDAKHSVIYSELLVGENVKIFPFCVIGRPPMSPSGLTSIDYSKLEAKPVYIGDNTIIGVHCVIYNNVRIGKNCLIGDQVRIREGVTIGDNCIIGIACKVGARTIIGTKTRIMDITNVASDAVIGNNVFIGPGVMMGNDNAMGRNVDFHTGIGPTIKDWAVIGMNASLLPCVVIGVDVLVGANSVVTKDVEDGTLVMGVPAVYKRHLTEGELRCQL